MNAAVHAASGLEPAQVQQPVPQQNPGLPLALRLQQQQLARRHGQLAQQMQQLAVTVGGLVQSQLQLQVRVCTRSVEACSSMLSR
jgi:hypothetical protein